MRLEFETLLVTAPKPGVVLVTLNRPASLNAVNTQMGRDLGAFWGAMAEGPEDCRAVVLTGQGERAFCAGGDLKERHGMSDEAWIAQHQVFERMVRAQIDCPVPVIAAVNGAAFGGGCEMVLTCDFAYASEQARFALTETTLGIIPGGGGTQTLPRLVGQARAREIIFSGKTFTAAEALQWGLINRLCAPASLLEDALEIAGRIADNAPLAVRQAKLAMAHGASLDLRTAMLFEIEAYNRLVGTGDRSEGVAAFNEKRKPRFRGA